MTDSNDPLVNGGAVHLTNQEALSHTLGRIEEALIGVRKDLHDLLAEQRQHHERLDSLDGRVVGLEGWQRARRDRARFIGTVAAILLVPAINWIQSSMHTVNKLEEVLEYHEKL
jgi:hypothetical protein